MEFFWIASTTHERIYKNGRLGQWGILRRITNDRQGTSISP